MDENMNDNSEKKTENTAANDTLKNLTNNLTKDGNSLDLNSIMQLTSSLLKNDTLMNHKPKFINLVVYSYLNS